MSIFRFALFSLRPITVDEYRHVLAIPDSNVLDCQPISSTSYEEFQRNEITEVEEIKKRIMYCEVALWRLVVLALQYQ